MDSQQVFVVPQVPVAPLSNSHATLSAAAPTPLVALQMPPQCAICGTTQKLLRCAKCKTIYYCSTDHQHLNWPIHKQECRQLARQRQINGRDRSLQQLTNGCNAININSNSITNTCSQSSTTGNWPLNYSAVANNHHLVGQSANPSASASHILGTNENEILNSKAESVTQHSNSSMYMGNFVANSTTCNQMHDMQSGHKPFPTQVDTIQFADNVASYQNMSAEQQQFTYNGAMELDTQQQQHVQSLQGYNAVYAPNQEPTPQLSNHLINQHEKSSSYQIGAAAVIDENAMENDK